MLSAPALRVQRSRLIVAFGSSFAEPWLGGQEQQPPQPRHVQHDVAPGAWGEPEETLPHQSPRSDPAQDRELPEPRKACAAL